MPLERPLLPFPTPRQVLADFGGVYAASALVAFLVSGVAMLLLGLSGWVRRAMDAVPMPVVMAMVAGVFLRFGVGLVQAFGQDLAIALSMTVTWLALGTAPALARKIPPLVGALVVGAGVIALEGTFKPAAGALFSIAAPIVYAPQFSWPALVKLVVPLFITV